MSRVETSLLQAVADHGREAVSFQALKPGLSCFRAGPGSWVPHAQTDGGWVAVGLPLVVQSDLRAASATFIEAARAAGARASFFAAETALPGLHAQCIGEQPEWTLSAWPATLAKARRLREQLRRARAAGVRVRVITPAEVRDGTPLRAAVDRLAQLRAARRPLEPLGFVLTPDVWEHANARRYLAAERHGRLTAFAVFSPIPQRRGWLLEDVLRAPDAPNGTAEALFDCAVRTLAAEGAEMMTMGLAPLAGRVTWPLRAARALGRPLYDFYGLYAFKKRLRPTSWRPVWLLTGEGSSPAICVLDVLRAFAGRPLWRFGVVSVWRRPAAACLALALPLVPWTLGLAALVATSRHGPLGYARAALGGWVIFDVGLCLGLWRAAHRPTSGALLTLAALATSDAVMGVARLARIGWPATLGVGLLRLVAVTAPVLGAALLWSAYARARTIARTIEG